MILPYVYKIVHRDTGQFYIGYRSANSLKAELDLPQYKTSSKLVEEIGFDNFNQEIVAEFFDATGAYDFEQLLISENMKDPLCLNRHCVVNGKNRFINEGKPCSEEKKRKLRKANLGKKMDDETKIKIAEALAGRELSPEHLAAISKPKQEATRAKMRKPKSESHRLNMEKARNSDEFRAKLRAAQQARREREKQTR